jgi:mannose-6-phosphate isomerase-like protein (cupin superfamily)
MKFFNSFSIKPVSLIAGMSCIFIVGWFASSVSAKEKQEGYLLEHEQQIARDEPGPHNGGGSTSAYLFFSKASGSKLVFRKRVLHLGAAIGYHLQKEEEIYYVVSGQGEMKMNGKVFQVNAGDAILTYQGSSHGLKQTGKDDLVLIINYNKQE